MGKRKNDLNPTVTVVHSDGKRQKTDLESVIKAMAERLEKDPELQKIIEDSLKNKRPLLF